MSKVKPISTTGLSRFAAAVENTFLKQSATANSAIVSEYSLRNAVAVCSTAATTAAKTATLDGFELETNCAVFISFSNATGGVASPTLNINGTGAKALYILHNGSSAAGSASRFLPAGVYIAMYDGTKWIIQSNGILKIASTGYTVF